MDKQDRGKVIVLKKVIDEDAAQEIIDSKKTGVFKSLLVRPKKNEVHVHSVKLYYECILMLSGRYEADYYRKVTHEITVPYNVREVVIGDGVFPINAKTRFEKVLARRHAKNKVDLHLEEHVFVAEENDIALDHHGHEVDCQFKINSETVENYPRRILSKHRRHVKKFEITRDAALSKLQSRLQKPPEPDVRDLNEEFVLDETKELYIPVFEARLVGPREKIGILRLDAVRKKIL